MSIRKQNKCFENEWCVGFRMAWVLMGRGKWRVRRWRRGKRLYVTVENHHIAARLQPRRPFTVEKNTRNYWFWPRTTHEIYILHIVAVCVCNTSTRACMLCHTRTHRHAQKHPFSSLHVRRSHVDQPAASTACVKLDGYPALLLNSNSIVKIEIEWKDR